VRLPVTNETNSLLQPLLTQSSPSPNPADVVAEEEKQKGDWLANEKLTIKPPGET
jgi:hypothetical protein